MDTYTFDPQVERFVEMEMDQGVVPREWHVRQICHKVYVVAGERIRAFDSSCRSHERSARVHRFISADHDWEAPERTNSLGGMIYSQAGKYMLSIDVIRLTSEENMRRGRAVWSMVRLDLRLKSMCKSPSLLARKNGMIVALEVSTDES